MKKRLRLESMEHDRIYSYLRMNQSFVLSRVRSFVRFRGGRGKEKKGESIDVTDDVCRIGLVFH